jgi:predicted DNA-binding transcriptional regulator YafY
MLIYMFTRLETLDYLIRSKSTGTPTALAQRLGISKRALFDALDTMRTLGAPVCYDKYRRCYYYSEEGEFCLRFKRERRIAPVLIWAACVIPFVDLSLTSLII